MSTRPNFLVIVADQLRADALGAFGRASAATPRLDELASRGTLFTNAFVQHPVCSPSRASFLTGRYPHTSGHRTLDGLLRVDEPNFLKAFRDGGYHVAWAGDRGDTFAPGATEFSVDEHGFAEPPSSDALGRSTAAGVDPAVPSVNHEAGDVPWERLFYGGRKDSGGTDFDEAAVRTVESWLVEPPSQPWLMFVPLLAPQCPFAIEEPWFSMHDRADQPAPVAPLDAETGPAYLSAIREKYGITGVSPEVWQEVAAVYQGMASRLDHHVGRIVDALETIGASDDTVIAFFSDHGEYLGDFGVIEKWPSAMHPCITRDPLIIGGGGLPAGQTSDTMVEIIDVFPTLLDLAGLDAEHSHYGRSLRTVLTDPSAAHRDFAFTEGGFLAEEEPRMERGPFPYDLKGQLQHERPELVGKAFAVRSPRWAYIWRLYERAELYDRQADPAEAHNLAGSPDHEGLERHMRDVLLRWLAETADVLPQHRDPRRPPVQLPRATTSKKGQRMIGP